MYRATLVLGVLFFGMGLGLACGKDSAPATVAGCIEGRSLGCSCVGGKGGAQVCTASGTFGPCECTPDDREALDADAQKRVAKQLRRLRRMRNWGKQRRAIGKLLAQANRRRAMASTAVEIRAANMRREEVLAIITKLAEPPRVPKPENLDGGVAQTPPAKGTPVTAKPVAPAPKIPRACRKDPNGAACQAASMKARP